MGLLDSLGLGDMLKSLLGQAESAGLPAVINNVLAQTQYRDPVSYTHLTLPTIYSV